MKTDTPESDAAWEYAWDEGGCHEGHLLDTMQKLECERDEARKAAEEWRETAGSCAAMPIVEHPFSWENADGDTRRDEAKLQK